MVDGSVVDVTDSVPPVSVSRPAPPWIASTEVVPAP
jgi:hypothetical protein